MRNRRRYKAVMAGIAFGTAGFIIVQTVGDSVEHKISDNLEILGGATIITADWNVEQEYHPGQFQMRDVHGLKKIPHLVAVAPVVSLAGRQVSYRDARWTLPLIGIDQAYWQIQSAFAHRGRLIGPTDVVGRQRVCVLGTNAAHYLFGREEPVGKTIRLDNQSFLVVGLLGGVQGGALKEGVVIPITTAGNLFPGLFRIQQILIRVEDWNRVAWARDVADSLLRASHRGYEDALRVMHRPELVQKVISIIQIVKLFVYASIVVTIVLGGIGISNVMLAAVQDRTKEIGLRKALGAKQELIMLQFLTEATFIGLLAGAIGGSIGVLAVQTVKATLDVNVSNLVLSTSVLVGFVFTIVLGIISGLYPSLRASRLDPVDAMRFE